MAVRTLATYKASKTPAKSIEEYTVENIIKKKSTTPSSNSDKATYSSTPTTAKITTPTVKAQTVNRVQKTPGVDLNKYVKKTVSTDAPSFRFLEEERENSIENIYKSLPQGTKDALSKMAYSANNGSVTNGAVVADANSLLPDAWKPTTLLTRYALNKQGYDGKALTDYAQSLYDKQLNDAQTVAAQKAAESNPVASNAMTVLANVGRIQEVPELLYSAITNTPIDTNKMQASNYVDTVRGTTSENIGNDTSGQKIANFAYQTGMSIADFLAASSAGGAAAPLLATTAGVSGTKAATERGASSRKALTTGIAQGLAEGIFERFSLGNLKTLASGTGAGLKTAITNIGKSMAIEGSEEVFTELSNNLTDYLINGGLSKYGTDITTYMQQGLSEQEATKLAQIDLAKSVGMAGLSGAVSGGVIGGGVSVLNNATGNINAPSQTGEESIVNEVLKEKNKSNEELVVNAILAEKRLRSKQTTEPIGTQNEALLNVAYPQNKPLVSTGTPTVSNQINTDQTTNLVSQILSNKRSGTSLDPIISETLGEQKLRSYGQNIANERTNLSSEVANEFKNNPSVYNVKTNKEAERISNEITSRGFDYSIAALDQLLLSKNRIALPLSSRVINTYAKNGNIEAAASVAERVSTALTESGQFSQAAYMNMVKDSPETAMRLMEKQLSKTNAEGQKKYKNKWKNVSLTETEMADYLSLEPGDAQKILEINNAVVKRIAKSMPSTLWEKIVAVSKVSMLLNPRTHIKNVVSNILLSKMRSASDRVSALGQKAVYLFNPNFEVTQSIVGGGKKEKAIAKEIYETSVKPVVSDFGKWNEASGLERKKQVIKSSKLGKWINNKTGVIDKLSKKFGTVNSGSITQAVIDFNYYLLGDIEDGTFVKQNFVNRLASYMKAQNIKSIEDVPDSAIELATEESLKATFKDTNEITKKFIGMKKSLGPVLGEIALPFVKTPANLAARSVDYSPVGLILAARNFKNTKDASKFFDDLSKGLTGSALIAAGFVLAKAGLITGALSDDKDEAQFQKQQGMQAFSVKIGDRYYSYDWAMPGSMSLVFAATIVDEFNKQDKEVERTIEDNFGLAKSLGLASVNAWISASPTQALADFLSGGYDNNIAENLFETSIESVNRLIPSLSNVTAKTIDKTARGSYSSGNFGKTLLDQAKAKIPGLRETLPVSYNTWGQPITTAESTGQAAFANFINPGTFSRDQKTELDGEISALFELEKDNKVFPRRVKWSPTINGETIRLDNEQYSAYQKEAGEKSYEFVEDYINSESYKKASNSEK